MSKNKKFNDDFYDYYDEDEVIDRRKLKKERRPVTNWKKGWEQGKITSEDDNENNVQMNRRS